MIATDFTALPADTRRDLQVVGFELFMLMVDKKNPVSGPVLYVVRRETVRSRATESMPRWQRAVSVWRYMWAQPEIWL